MVKGICAFDIDQTLTCGKSACSLQQQYEMRDAINYCRKNDMKVVINTARPPQQDPKHSIPRLVNELLSDVEVRTRSRTSENTVPQDKYLHMVDLAKKYNVPLKNTILIDDLLETCNHVTQLGGNSIHVKDEKGVTRSEYTELENMIKKI
jgi:hydroxymethylpyrimidine pyrophosphatase-like HAD family hydrolase